MSTQHVVVDGSNLATEGRTLPSLSQLEEAVAAYEDEHPGVDVIVVVDATFEHRIEEADRARFKEAELRGEYVSPPAGAIGRGDAFVLKIAKRTGAVVLSNDSFQEFHGEHPWLFEEGRLIGGKPVPVVGWIFTPRNPVRGAKSRAATKEAAKKAGPPKKLVVRRPDGSTPKVGDTLTPAGPPEPVSMRIHEIAKRLGLDSKSVLALAKTAKVKAASHASSIDPEGVEKILEAAKNRKIKAQELASELDLALKELKDLAASVQIKVSSAATPLSQDDATQLRKAAERRAKRAQSASAVLEVVAVAPEEEGDPEASKRGRRRRGRRKGADRDPGETPRSQTPSDVPQNEPLDLVTFLATHEVGASLEGVVSAFTSHGAMVEVAMSSDRSFNCYVRTVNLGTPPPTKARDVLRKGTTYVFELLSIDASRRIAELTYRGASVAASAGDPAEPGASKPSSGRRGRGRSRRTSSTPDETSALSTRANEESVAAGSVTAAKSAPRKAAAKSSPAKSAATKKTASTKSSHQTEPTKKSPSVKKAPPAKKVSAAKKATGTKKVSASASATTSAPKKAAAKSSPAKSTAAKKSPAKKTASLKKTPAKKGTTSRGSR